MLKHKCNSITVVSHISPENYFYDNIYYDSIVEGDEILTGGVGGVTIYWHAYYRESKQVKIFRISRFVVKTR